MAAIVIDASIASAWCFPEEKTDYTEAVFDAVGSSRLEPLVPALWSYEVPNTVLMGLRRGRIAKPDSEKFLAALRGMTVVIAEPIDYESAVALAEKHRLTFYDAAYLSLAIF